MPASFGALSYRNRTVLSLHYDSRKLLAEEGRALLSAFAKQVGSNFPIWAAPSRPDELPFFPHRQLAPAQIATTLLESEALLVADNCAGLTPV